MAWRLSRSIMWEEKCLDKNKKSLDFYVRLYEIIYYNDIIIIIYFEKTNTDRF